MAEILDQILGIERILSLTYHWEKERRLSEKTKQDNHWKIIF